MLFSLKSDPEQKSILKRSKPKRIVRFELEEEKGLGIHKDILTNKIEEKKKPKRNIFSRTNSRERSRERSKGK